MRFYRAVFLHRLYCIELKRGKFAHPTKDLIDFNTCSFEGFKAGIADPARNMRSNQNRALTCVTEPDLQKAFRFFVYHKAHYQACR